MSGYPPSDPFGTFSGNQPLLSVADNYPPPQPYPPSNTPYPGNYPYPSQTSYPGNYPYPSQTSYPASPNMMSGNNSGYPGAGGYPTSPGGYPNSGYPNSGNVSGPGGPQISPGMNPQVCPTAPDLGQMEKIPGYEQLTFDDAIVMPPSLPAWKPESQERSQLDKLPSLTEEEVRDAVIQYSSEHCCYGSGAAKNLVVTNISMMSAFHYQLETFTEKRESAWRFQPYNGQPIDGPMNGPAPRPWDIQASPSTYFIRSQQKREVPHTAFVKPCHTCVGNSRVRCEHCHGNGRDECTWCKGRGFKTSFDNEERCTSCEGTGYRRCTWCHGSGQVECKTCTGKGQLKGYVELVITWSNHVDDYISETSSMPKELVRSVSGQVAFQEENPRVYPIMHSSDQAVNNASNEYINKHSRAFPNERIIKQRHNLRLIPIGEVNYTWNEKVGQFYVYGYEHKVYFDNYPQKCCCCTIL